VFGTGREVRRALARHVHQPVGEEIRSIAGYYMVLEEGMLKYRDREVLYLLEAAAADTSCCGGAGMGFIMVPGYVRELRAGKNEDGLWVSEVDRVEDEGERREITRELRARHPGFHQIIFA
jgi:hypothetical protein